jgi:DUF971 family protein
VNIKPAPSYSLQIFFKGGIERSVYNFHLLYSVMSLGEENMTGWKNERTAFCGPNISRDFEWQDDVN